MSSFFKKKKFDYIYLVIIIVLLLAILIITWLINEKNQENNGLSSIFKSVSAENKDEGESSSPPWLQGLLDSLLGIIQKAMETVLNKILGLWIINLVLLPILNFLTAFNAIIYELSGGSLIGKQVNPDTGEKYSFFNVPTMFLVVTITSIFIFLVISLINVLVVIYSTKSDGARVKTTLHNMMSAAILFCLLPAVFLLTTMIFNTLMSLVNDAMNIVNGINSSRYGVADSIANLGSPNSPIVFNGEGSPRYSVISGIADYQVLYPVIVSIAFLIGYLYMTITIIQQLYAMLVLYFWSGLSLVNFTNDEGQMFKQCWGQFKGKLITNFSIVLGIQLFTYINPIIISYTDKINTTDSIVKLFIKVATLLAGLMFMMGFPNLVGQFTGETLNMQEGRNGLLSLRGGVGAAVNPAKTIAKSARNRLQTSSGTSARSMAKNFMKDKKNKERAEIMKMKMQKGSSYKRHKAWVDKNLDKFNEKF